MAFAVNIYVSLKSTVSDPQGATVSGALSQLGFDSVKDVLSSGIEVRSSFSLESSFAKSLI